LIYKPPPPLSSIFTSKYNNSDRITLSSIELSLLERHQNQNTDYLKDNYISCLNTGTGTWMEQHILNKSLPSFFVVKNEHQMVDNVFNSYD